ncbi:MAG: PQQ-like beta-propeller repeat protein [Chthoniobacter sp.]|nr:PQQ-like beta-propeller repeat protein [Chthoniobacter sp.]
MTRSPFLVAAFAAGFFHVICTASADWMHYRGPTAQGVSAEKLPAIPADGPKQIWKTAVGVGTSSVTVSGEHVFTMGNVEGTDTVWCLHAKTGAVVWKHEYPLDLDKRMFEGGTAATPTLDGPHVYTVSHQGDLFCLNAATGKPVWYKHYQKDFGGKRPQWGFAGSPTVEGNLLLLDVGGNGASTVALNKLTGAMVWKSGDDKAGYASPVVATLAGKKTVVMFKAGHVVGLDLKDGHELWRSAWKTSYDVNAATPIATGDTVFISSGYGSGCGLVAVAARGATEHWRNKSIRSHFNTPALLQGHVYGIDGQDGSGSPLTCLDLATGETKWQEKSVGGGAAVIVDGKLLCLTEKGELVIAEATSAGFKPISRTQVLGKRCWVQPTYANGRIFCRNNQGDLVALELK